MIKFFVASLLLTFTLTLSSKAQQPNCKKFKYGTFKMDFEGRKGIIKRYDNIQEEYMNGDGKPTMTFTVKWLNDCTYTLTPTANTRKDFPNIPSDGTMTVTILGTTSNSYSFTAVFNWDKKTSYKNTLTLIK